jgi:hypothetical protein
LSSTPPILIDVALHHDNRHKKSYLASPQSPHNPKASPKKYPPETAHPTGPPKVPNATIATSKVAFVVTPDLLVFST